MPRGMDERFSDPEEDEEKLADDAADPAASASEDGDSNDDESSEQRSTATDDSTENSADEPLNIREDWDSATIYVEPEQSEDIEVTFTRLKKQLRREDITLEKNKHFYRGIFEVAFGDHREETKAKIRELAKQDADL